MGRPIPWFPSFSRFESSGFFIVGVVLKDIAYREKVQNVNECVTESLELQSVLQVKCLQIPVKKLNIFLKFVIPVMVPAKTSPLACVTKCNQQCSVGPSTTLECGMMEAHTTSCTVITLFFWTHNKEKLYWLKFGIVFLVPAVKHVSSFFPFIRIICAIHNSPHLV